MYDDYLIHHGVKGQKWGVRRDASKTPAGREKARATKLKRAGRAVKVNVKRVGKVAGKGGKKAKTVLSKTKKRYDAYREEHRRTKIPKSVKKMRRLSDKDLAKVVERYKKEADFMDTRARLRKQKLGSRFIDSVANAAVSGLSRGISDGSSSAIKSAFEYAAKEAISSAENRKGQANQRRAAQQQQREYRDAVKSVAQQWRV